MALRKPRVVAMKLKGDSKKLEGRFYGAKGSPKRASEELLGSKIHEIPENHKIASNEGHPGVAGESEPGKVLRAGPTHARS